MRRARAVGSVAVALVALAATFPACGGDDEAPPSQAPSADAPSGDGAPPRDPSALPPELVECMADRGFELKSSADIHSAPPEVVEACFGSLHQGGGAP